MVGLGVASFGHVNGVHVQNLDTWETYSAAIDATSSRSAAPTGRRDEERLIREFILQLKRGWVRPGYFQRQVRRRRAATVRRAARSLAADGFLAERRARRGRADARRAAARRRAAAAVLPARARWHPLHLMPSAMPSALSTAAPSRAVPRDRLGRHRPFQLLLPLHGGGRARAVARGRPEHRRRGRQVGFPRVAAAFDYHRPLRFEDEFDVAHPHRRR